MVYIVRYTNKQSNYVNRVNLHDIHGAVSTALMYMLAGYGVKINRHISITTTQLEVFDGYISRRLINRQKMWKLQLGFKPPNRNRQQVRQEEHKNIYFLATRFAKLAQEIEDSRFSDKPPAGLNYIQLLPGRTNNSEPVAEYKADQ